jgi:hypothetical protein
MCCRRKCPSVATSTGKEGNQSAKNSVWLLHERFERNFEKLRERAVDASTNVLEKQN